MDKNLSRDLRGVVRRVVLHNSAFSNKEKVEIINGYIKNRLRIKEKTT
jgi:hypothetical protein